MDAKLAPSNGNDSQLAPPPRAQLPDVARLTGIPERTLQHWFRSYASYRSRRGYPQQLVLDVLRDHDWDGDTGAVARGLVGDGVTEQAIERRAVSAPEPVNQVEPAAIAGTDRYAALMAEVAALRSQQADLASELLQELQRVRALSTQVATLNELRGVRDDLTAVRVGQQRAEQAQQVVQDQVLQLVATSRKARRRWPFQR